jgi:hypothetical protein
VIEKGGLELEFEVEVEVELDVVVAIDVYRMNVGIDST